jgi:hypothetical protein
MNGNPRLVPSAVVEGDYFPSPTFDTVKPADEARAKAEHYQYEDGDFFIPGEALWAALKDAGQFVRFDEKRQITQGRKSLLKELIKIEEEDCVIEVRNKKRQWVTRNPSNGQPIQIARPRFDRWEFTAYVGIRILKVTERQVRELFDKAGKRYGLLYNRPALKGTNGQFIVKRWQRL